MNNAASIWPQLPYPAWRDTATTLQLWTQIVGKIRLVLSPWVNHGWQVPFYVTARGLTTSPIPVVHEILDIEFDFLRHHLVARTSRGEERSLPLEPQSVADFYHRVVDLLNGLGVAVAINERPNEVSNPIAFSFLSSTYEAAAETGGWDRAALECELGVPGRVRRL
jgi:Family of unknown function (DUF5996)